MVGKTKTEDEQSIQGYKDIMPERVPRYERLDCISFTPYLYNLNF